MSGRIGGHIQFACCCPLPWVRVPAQASPSNAHFSGCCWVLLLPVVKKAVFFRVSVTVRSPPAWTNRLQASGRGSCHMQAELQVKRLYTALLAAVPLVYRTWCRTKPTHLLAWQQQHGWWACNRDKRKAGTKVNSMPAVLLASQTTYTTIVRNANRWSRSSKAQRKMRC